MGKFDLATIEQRMDFGNEFFPRIQGSEWHMPVMHEIYPLEEPTTRCLGLLTAHIIEGGLRLPLDPLILEVLRATGVPLSKFNLNAIRLMCSFATLNKRHNLELRVKELFYCVKLVKSKYGEKYHLAGRPNSPELVFCLLDSVTKGAMERSIVITAGPILPPGMEDFSFPRVSTMRVRAPSRPALGELKLMHINALIRHVGFSNDPLDHPRATFNLLSNQSKLRSFNRRVSSQQWVGELMEEKDLFLFFKAHGIQDPINKQYEDELVKQADLDGIVGHVAKKIIQVVVENQERYDKYLADLRENDESAAEMARIRVEEIEARGETEGWSPDRLLMELGCVRIPTEEESSQRNPRAAIATGVNPNRQSLLAKKAYVKLTDDHVNFRFLNYSMF